MLDLPHPFWAKNGELEKTHITAARNDLPGIAAHTAAGGPKRAHEFVKSTGLDLRTRIPLARSALFLRRAASSLLIPSLTVFGAPSTRSLASFRPRLVTSRTALMTLILLPPTS